MQPRGRLRVLVLRPESPCRYPPAAAGKRFALPADNRDGQAGMAPLTIMFLYEGFIRRQVSDKH